MPMELHYPETLLTSRMSCFVRFRSTQSVKFPGKLSGRGRRSNRRGYLPDRRRYFDSRAQNCASVHLKLQASHVIVAGKTPRSHELVSPIELDNLAGARRIFLSEGARQGVFPNVCIFRLEDELPTLRTGR